LDSPTPPDPYATANTQQQFNQKAATAQQGMNMVDQSNPYGTTKYSQTGTNPDGTPKYSVSTAFSAPQQQLYDSGNALKMGQLGAAQNLMNSGQGAFSGKGVDLSYNGTTAALDALNKTRLDPQWAQNTDMQESKLANQGVTPGTPAYDNAMRVFNQGKNDAYNSANLADYGLSSQNALAQYNSPLQTYQGLTNGTTPQGPTSGNVNVPQTNVAGTNYAGLAEQNYQQQSQNANSQNGQIAGLVGTAAGIGLAPFTGGMSLGMAGGGMGGLFGSKPSTGSTYGGYGSGGASNGMGSMGGNSYPAF
jgi:hypothetical protein